MKKLIIENSGQEVFDFISQYCNFDDNSTIALKTRTKFNIENIDNKKYKNIVNLKKINDIRRINKFLEVVNYKIPEDGIFISKVETIELRKKRLINKYLPGLNYIYVFLDFIFKRIFPKLPFTKRIYFFITQGRNR
ncbi:MAG: hypothetical protein PHD97_02265, partial [Bacteroidales bacterium]|nr:hypothetical protein [Bacteroidales bacterium]